MFQLAIILCETLNFIFKTFSQHLNSLKDIFLFLSYKTTECFADRICHYQFFFASIGLVKCCNKKKNQKKKQLLTNNLDVTDSFSSCF